MENRDSQTAQETAKNFAQFMALTIQLEVAKGASRGALAALDSLLLSRIKALLLAPIVVLQYVRLGYFVRKSTQILKQIEAVTVAEAANLKAARDGAVTSTQQSTH